MKRRILSVLMVAMLLFSTMAVTSFADAEGDSTKTPEAVALVSVTNAECKMIEQMKDLKVIIKLQDGTVISEVPVERVEEEEGDLVALWLGYSYDEIDADIKAQLAEFQKDFHLGSWEDLMNNMWVTEEDTVSEFEKSLQEIFSRYVIEITGIPESDDHEFKIETNTMLITSTLVSELLDMAKELIGEMLELSKDEIAAINSVQDLIDVIEGVLIEEKVINEGQDIFDALNTLMEEPLTDEEKAQLTEYVVQIDETLAYMQSEDYTGTVFAGIYMECTCPYTVGFEIYHQYFKEVDGKMTLAGTANYGPMTYAGAEESDSEWGSIYEYDFEGKYYEGLSGDIIKAADYIQTEYNGETYEYIGSYDSMAVLYPNEDIYYTKEYVFDTLDELYNSKEWQTEYQAAEFVLGDEDWDAPLGLVLRYELKGDPADTPVIVDDADGNPQTGDDSNMTPYVVIMFAAIAVMAAAVLARRRQTN